MREIGAIMCFLYSSEIVNLVVSSLVTPRIYGEEARIYQFADGILLVH